MKSKFIFLLLIFFFVKREFFAQSPYFTVGYQIGQLGNGVNSLRNEIEFMNRVTYPNLTSPLKMSPFVSGLNLGLILQDDEDKSFYFFWNWSNNRVVAHGNGTFNNQEMKHSFKYRHNYFNIFGIGYKIKKWIGIGYSPVDLGHLKVLYKNSTIEKAHSYTDYYNVEKGILSDYNIYGSSYYLDFFLKDRLRIRFSYYRSYNGVELRDQEDIRTVKAYNANRFNMSLNYMFKLKD